MRRLGSRVLRGWEARASNPEETAGLFRLSMAALRYHSSLALSSPWAD